MKKSLLFLAIAFGSMAAHADLYVVDPMICRGKLMPNARVHESYTELLQKFESFTSMRRNGTPAPSLEVSNAYGNPGEQLEEASARWGEVWQMAPLRVKGNKVTHPNFVGTLDLTITSSKTAGGTRTDTLTGVWFQGDSVAGGHGYNVTCTANVVKTPARTVDCRRGCEQ